jgi:Ser/Thr protein kinase RdoA (MazF antagonist)
VVAIPWRDRAGRTFRVLEDGVWQVEPWMPGAARTATPDAASVRAAFGLLGALHRAWEGEEATAPAAGLVVRAERLAWLRGGGFGEVEAWLRDAADGEIGGLGAAWLAAARREAPRLGDRIVEAAARPRPVQPCLRDCRPGHFLFTGGRVTGLVDFGAMEVDTPVVDLARLLGEWLPQDGDLRRAGLDAYLAARPIGREVDALLGLVERSSALLTGLNWLRWHLAEGRAFPAGAVAAGLRRSLERMVRPA